MRFAPILALAPMLLPISPVLAQSQPIRVRNMSPVLATGLFLAPSGTAAWGGNLLGGQFLSPRAFLSVQLGEGGGCRFDLRMVLRDGREAVRRDVDVCAERLVAMAIDPAPEPSASAAPGADATRARP